MINHEAWEGSKNVWLSTKAVCKRDVKMLKSIPNPNPALGVVKK